MDLHQSCRWGEAERAQRVLDTGRVHVDCQEEEVRKIFIYSFCYFCGESEASFWKFKRKKRYFGGFRECAPPPIFYLLMPFAVKEEVEKEVEEEDVSDCLKIDT